jgi:hypothetical protein
MFDHLSKFVLMVFPPLGAAVIGGFLLVGYYVHPVSSPARADRTPVADEPTIVTDDSSSRTPRPSVVAETSPAAQAIIPASADARPAAKTAPRRVAAVTDKPRVGEKRDPAPLQAACCTAPPAAPAAPLVIAPAERVAATPPKPDEPVRVLGVTVLPVIVAVGEKLDPTPIWRTGGKVIDTVVATAKSVVPDFSR